MLRLFEQLKVKRTDGAHVPPAPFIFRNIQKERKESGFCFQKRNIRRQTNLSRAVPPYQQHQQKYGIHFFWKVHSQKNNAFLSAQLIVNDNERADKKKKTRNWKAYFFCSAAMPLPKKCFSPFFPFPSWQAGFVTKY